TGRRRYAPPPGRADSALDECLVERVDRAAERPDVHRQAIGDVLCRELAVRDPSEELARSRAVRVELGEGLLGGGVVTHGDRVRVVDEVADVLTPQLEERGAVLLASERADALGEGDGVR